MPGNVIALDSAAPGDQHTAATVRCWRSHDRQICCWLASCRAHASDSWPWPRRVDIFYCQHTRAYYSPVNEPKSRPKSVLHEHASLARRLAASMHERTRAIGCGRASHFQAEFPATLSARCYRRAQSPRRAPGQCRPAPTPKSRGSGDGPRRSLPMTSAGPRPSKMRLPRCIEQRRQARLHL